MSLVLSSSRRGCAGILAALHNTLGDAAHGDQFRRPDHRCRPVRHQHGLPTEDAVPRQTRGTARTAQGHRRHLGPVPLSGCALRLGHVHLRLPVSAVERVEGAGRRRVDPSLRRRHGARIRHSQGHPLRHQDHAGQLVERAQALDDRGHRREQRRGLHLHLQLPGQLHRLLQPRPGSPAELSRHRALQGAMHPPAALAEGAGLPRQARRRHRQRRDRGDARAVDGAGHRAHHDAAALAQLCVFAALARPDLGRAAALPARSLGLRPGAPAQPARGAD